MAAPQTGADPGKRPIRYRPDIDGLRAVAVISVVIYHCVQPLAPGGFVGVDVFFVISGYLIGALVYREVLSGGFRIAKFYERRAKRILPTLFGVLLFSYIVGCLLLSPSELTRLSQSALATLASSSNFFFMHSAADYYASDSSQNPLLMTWSLGVEEQFYILFPLLMLLLGGKRRRWQFWAIAGLSAISLAICLERNHWYPGFAFYMLPARAWEIGCGVLLAIFEADRPHSLHDRPAWIAHGLSFTGAGMIALALFPLNAHAIYPGPATLLPVIGAVCLIAARDGFVNRMLTWRPAVFVGLISYSWYLWHWPMLSFAHIVSDETISVRAGAGIALFSFGCAALSYFFVEHPFRRSTTPTRPLLWRYVGLAATISLPALALLLTNGWPQRNQVANQLDDRLLHDVSRRVCQASPGVIHPTLSAPCVSLDHVRAVALIGDSHASALASTLRGISESEGYGFAQITEGWCPPLGADVARVIPTYPTLVGNCAEFNRERVAFLLANPTIKAVFLAAHWAEPLQLGDEPYATADLDPTRITPEQNQALLERGLRAIVSQLTQAGKQVYLVQDNPEMPFNPMRQIMTRVIGPRRVVSYVLARATMKRLHSDSVRVVDYAPQQSARKLIADVAAEYPNVHLVDLEKGLCSADGCRFAEANASFYWDWHHLTNLGARVALDNFRIPQ